MKSYQMRSADPAEPLPTRPRPGGLSRARAGLPLLLLAFCLAMAFLSPGFAADGDLDPSFITGTGQFSGVQTIPEIRGQAGYPKNIDGSDGPLNGYSLLYGTFYGVKVGDTYPPNYGGNSCIARLKADGTLDTGFSVNGSNNYQINGEIRGVFIYPHDYPVTDLRDKILVWGRINAGSGSIYYSNFARLNPNGDLDTSLTPVIFSWGGAINSVAVQGGGSGGALGGTTDKILVGGFNLGLGDDNPACQLVRLMYDGSLDTGFTHWGAPNGYINSVKIVSDPTFGSNNVRLFCSYPKNQDGSGGTYYFLLLNPNANIPSPSNPPIAFLGDETVDGPISNMAMQSDRKWLICGQFNNVYDPNSLPPSWVPRKRVARLGTDAKTLDTTYDVGVGPNGVVTGISPVMATPPDYDDRMVVAGNFTTWNGSSCAFMARLNTDGTLGTFNSGGTGADDRIRNLRWKADGSGGWIYGYFRNYNSNGTDYPRGGIAGLNANGTVNTSFANVTAMAWWPGMVYSLATQSDGKILIGGDFNGVGGRYRGGFARIYPDGSLDTSFKGAVDGIVRSVAVQADGKILLGGEFGQCQSYACTSLARLNPDGSYDLTFNPRLVGGDNSLNFVNHVVPLSNGQIMVAGDIWNDNGGSPVVRLNSDGSLDAEFFANASQFILPEVNWTTGSRVALVGNNYLVAGVRDTNTPENGGFLARFKGNGLPDTDFGPSAPVPNVQILDRPAFDMLLQSDGKIVVSGFFSQIIGANGNTARPGIARFSANGELDTTFAPSLTPPSPADTIIISAMALQPNGKILIEENFLQYVSDINWQYVATQVARLNPTGSLDPNFTLGNLANGWFYPYAGNSILRLPSGKALIGGCYGTYNSTPAWSLVRIFAGGGSFNPSIFMLLLD